MQILLASVSAAVQDPIHPLRRTVASPLLCSKGREGWVIQKNLFLLSPIAVGHLTHPPNRCHRPSAAPPFHNQTSFLLPRSQGVIGGTGETFIGKIFSKYKAAAAFSETSFEIIIAIFGPGRCFAPYPTWKKRQVERSFGSCWCVSLPREFRISNKFDSCRCMPASPHATKVSLFCREDIVSVC